MCYNLFSTKEIIMSELNLKPEKIREFRCETNRVETLYLWVQNNKITVDEFRTLLYENAQENQRQIDLDIWD